MQLPSASCHRYFMVLSSFETCFRATTGGVMPPAWSILARRALGTSVISSVEATPRLSHWKSCLPRNAG